MIWLCPMTRDGRPGDPCFHVFREPGSQSLCGEWRREGEMDALERTSQPAPRLCVTCRRKARKTDEAWDDAEDNF